MPEIGEPERTGAAVRPRCRNKLRAAGLPYPKSTCEKCGHIIRPGWHCAEEAVDNRVEAAAQWLIGDDSAYEHNPPAAYRAAKEMLAASDLVAEAPKIREQLPLLRDALAKERQAHVEMEKVLADELRVARDNIAVLQATIAELREASMPALPPPEVLLAVTPGPNDPSHESFLLHCAAVSAADQPTLSVKEVRWLGRLAGTPLSHDGLGLRDDLQLSFDSNVRLRDMIVKAWENVSIQRWWQRTTGKGVAGHDE